MAKEMLINVSEGEECRIALMENGKLEEFYIERTSSTSHVGNIYRGKVVNVEASIQAAFIDFGLGRNGFLHISDLLPSYFGRKGEDVQESVGRKLARRDRPPIQRCLRRGDDIIVQIIKEGIGTKGPTLTTYLSIPGRILVMMPGMSKMGVSRKIEDEDERRRLRRILDGLEPPEDCGFIIRTAGVGRTKAEIQRDLHYLARLWQQVNRKLASGSGPMTLYTEGDLVTRTVRDIFSTEIDRIVIDNARVTEQVADFIKLTSPRAKDKVELYDGLLPLFHKYNIEKEIEMMYSRHVPLPSGGSLVIDQTEAVVSIDVNSGKFRDHSDAETTAFKTDMEAADEIPRQLKLRDLGGVIICDFIDLRYDRHRRELENRLHENFSNDRAKTKVLRMSQFGIIELTRQRMRPSVKRSIYCDCPHCHGSGLVKTPESMSLDVMRKLAIATHDERVVRVELTVHSDVAYYLNNRKRGQLADLEAATGKRVIIKTGDVSALDDVRFELFDARDGMVLIEDLLAHAPQSIQEAQIMALQARGERQDRRGGDRRGGGRFERPDRRESFERREEPEERFDREEIPEEDVEERGPRHDEGFEPEIEAAEGEEIEVPASVESADEEIGEAPTEIEADYDTPAPIAEGEEEPVGAEGALEGEEPAGHVEAEEEQASRLQRRPQQPRYQEERGGFPQDDRGGRRGRGRLGRGRGRNEQQRPQPSQEPPAHREGDSFRPAAVWVDMPGEEDAQPQGRDVREEAQATSEQTRIAPVQATPVQGLPVKQAPKTPVTVAPIAAAPIADLHADHPAKWREPQVVALPPVRIQQPVRTAAVVSPDEPVSVAPIAEMPVVTPAIRSTPPVPTVVPARPTLASAPETEEETGKGKKKRTTTRKTAAKASAKTTATKKATTSRSKKKTKVEEADIEQGAAVDEPTTGIGMPVEEPTVRIADEPALTSNGDRHLASDEPVDPEAERVVKSRRDLDHVPEVEE